MSPAPISMATNLSNSNSILPAFNDPVFSDLIVLSGPSKTPFRIHKVIVSATSNFFKTICKPGNHSNGGSQIIELPKIPPTVLQTILLWQYGQPYVLPPHTPPSSSSAHESKFANTLGRNEDDFSTESLIITTYSTAVYLQIPLLQSAILTAIADEFRFRPWIRFTRPVGFMQNLCNHHRYCLHVSQKQPITKTTSSDTSVFPSADHSGKINFVPRIRSGSGDNKTPVVECVSVMVASHNFKDLANEIETLKGEKVKAKGEGETSRLDDLDFNRDDGLFTVILPVWEDFVRKKEERRVLEPRNDPRIFTIKEPNHPRAPKSVYRLIDLSVLLGFIWLIHHYWEISSLILGWGFMIFGICCFLFWAILSYRLYRQGVWSW
ncbi:uncharacterized protein DFL_008958 [Arthrobotrys flagrans]|uniref:BTB domain-containing protein n=1 Tax=Arthrobotrys flagrans TaxID=97331 RepID=A0A436ZQ97_ARTFL|nr:hypothetical protein DFL_008958 [Arthrobotrys flagrans]